MLVSTERRLFAMALLVMSLPAVSGEVAATELAAADYREFAQRELLRALRPESGRLETTIVGKHRDLEVPAGNVKLNARVPDRIRSKACVWVDVSVNGRALKSIPVRFDVQWMRPALVTRDHIAARTALSEQRVVLKKIDVAGARGEALIEVSQVLGKRLRRELAADAVIGSEDIEALPSVAVGERVDVYAQVGGVVVRTVGVAQRDGFEGDRINVRVDGRPETLRVQVVGKNRVTVIENANTRSF